MPKFSIVIPALNEAAGIGETVASLSRLRTPRSKYEIVVVDNGSTDRTAEVAFSAGADLVVTEHVKGTNIARQRGVTVSSGEIIAFLDADSQPPPDWLEHIEQNLSRNGAVATTGPYDHGFRGLKRLLDRLYTHVIIPMIPSILRLVFRRKAGMLIEGNFAVWRWALDRIGGLPPIKFYGDGAATAMLLTRRVGSIWYDPTLNVRSSTRRFEKHGLLTQVYRYAVAYLKMYFSKRYR